MGLPIIGLALSIGGSLINGVMQGAAAQRQAEIENKQLEVDRETERIRALQEGNDRQEQAFRAEATNKVAASIAAAGGRNYSYEQGIAPYNKQVVARDLATVGFNSTMEQGRMSYRIAVNSYQADMNSRMAMVGSFTDSLASVASFMSRPGGLLA